MKIFLDDYRHPEDVYPKKEARKMETIRNYRAFIASIEANGFPEFISFDYDLGLDITGMFAPTGLDCALWLIENYPKESKTLNYKVHSSYPNAQQIFDKALASNI